MQRPSVRHYVEKESIPPAALYEMPPSNPSQQSLLCGQRRKWKEYQSQRIEDRGKQRSSGSTELGEKEVAGTGLTRVCIRSSAYICIIAFTFQLRVFMALLSVWRSASLILVPALEDLFLLLRSWFPWGSHKHVACTQTDRHTHK